nr:glutathione peroxidase [Devosia pacifica]
MPLLNGRPVPFEDYRGKHLLIVNVASKCGLTPQYAGLEVLWRKFRDQGLMVLGFPCNQFGEQEPGSSSEIAEFCSTTYDVTFPVFEKIEVNGDNTDALFAELKRQKPGDIAWNFTKFLVAPNGEVVERFEPQTAPEDMTDTIAKALD